MNGRMDPTAGSGLDATGRRRMDGWMDGYNWLTTDEWDWPRPDGWMDEWMQLAVTG